MIDINFEKLSDITIESLTQHGYNQQNVSGNAVYTHDTETVSFLGHEFFGCFECIDRELQCITLTPVSQGYNGHASDAKEKADYYRQLLVENITSFITYDLHIEYAYVSLKWALPHCIVICSEHLNDPVYCNISIYPEEYYSLDRIMQTTVKAEKI